MPPGVGSNEEGSSRGFSSKSSSARRGRHGALGCFRGCSSEGKRALDPFWDCSPEDEEDLGSLRDCSGEDNIRGIAKIESREHRAGWECGVKR